jgi:hypothetical protein
MMMAVLTVIAPEPTEVPKALATSLAPDGRAEEFEHGGYDDGGPDGNSAGADRGAQSIGDIVGADAPGHEQAEDHRDSQEGRTVRGNDVHRLDALALLWRTR